MNTRNSLVGAIRNTQLNKSDIVRNHSKTSNGYLSMMERNFSELPVVLY